MAATLDKAAVDRRAREIETEYLSSLADLNVNSKPLINMLTILAEENLDYAPVIVNAVEKHLAKVQPDVKLPILYLVDSIVKNVGKQYQLLFSQVIVNMFCGVFETVNERVREKMFSLRQTWNEVFPQSKLYALDIKINSIDPGWPITAQLKPSKSPAIHVNPIFLKNQQIPDPTLDMQQQLRDKQRELLELQNKKLELELMATKKRIEEQEKQLVLQTASVSKEPATDLKRPASAVGSATVPPPRGRIVPPNAAMINLVKSRDPRLARQQAQLVAQMTAASTNSTPTMVAGVQVPPHHPITLDPSTSKPLSIRDRLGRIPKRTDPRIKAAQVTDADRKKATSATTTSTTSNSLSPSHRSRSEYDPTKKREKKDDATSKSGRSPSSKSSNADKKKSSTEMSSPKSSSPLKKKSSSSSEKSPSRSEKISPKLREGKVSKSGKSATCRPGDPSKGSDDSSVSPSSSSENLIPVANESKDVDLRLLIPEKKLKLDQPQQQQAKLVSKPLPDQKKALGEAVATDNVPSPPMAISRDVDLRIPPLGLLKDVSDSVVPNVVPVVAAITTTATTGSSEVVPSMDTIPPATVAGMGLPSEGVKKRPSIHKLDEEPANKKSKSEKLDILFGSEDVDLRKLAGPMNPIEPITPLPPPPPIISEATTRPVAANSVQNESMDKHSATSKAALEAVRAKIAEATKNKDRDKLGRPLLYNKLSDDPVERRRSLSQTKPMDVDLRQQQHQFQHLDATGDDNSQDGMNANIKTIVAQAQEQMEKGEITPEQYNILMKQVIQLNETQKIRQAQRMEMMKRNQQPVTLQAPDDNANTHSGEEMASFSPSLSDDGEMKPNVPPQAKNDFRGKITPLDAKPNMEPQFPNVAAPVGDIRQRDPRRQQHETRFNPQWGIRAPMPGPNAMPPVAAGPVMNQRPPGPPMGVNPWDQAPFSVMKPNMGPLPIGSRFPPVPMNNGPPASMLVPGVPKMNDSVRTINIDGIQREIRFYDDIAVIFMSWDEPKEIGFQKGSRMVVVDDRDSFELSFNECYKAITIEGKVYQMKLGAPTREMYIDSSWYECYFGDPPTNIVLDGINRVFKISGPAPQVKIGNSRNDLVAGKINMIVNAEVIVPVFLDSQVQMFEIYGQMHKLQFADFLLTVIIDDQPFPVEYGGLPKVFKLRGKDLYIRFTAVPKLVVPGRVYIRDMIRTPLHRDLRTPPRDQSLLPPFVPPMNNMMPPMGMQHPVPSLFPAAATMQPKPPGPMHPTATGLDYLTNLMPHSSSLVNVSNNLAGYQIQPEDKPIVPPVTVPAPAPAIPAAGGLNLPILQNLNIDELYQKIVAAGILGKTNSAPARTTTSTTSTANTTAATSSTPASTAASKLEKALEEEVEEIEPVFLNKVDTLKRRQSAIVAQLFIGMQCSSCGVRFPPEQTMKYSQHLDWHFRQNRRDRDSARKAHSRKWYYDVSDWIQYEEIEDLEEREKNWFESQQTEQIEFNGDGESGGGRAGAETPPPSCPAGSDEASKRCHMCHDDFQQFYNEETEEWHLKNAIRVEDCTYHPLCYEDYKASLTLDESAMNATNEEGDQSKTDDGVKIKKETVSDADDSVKEITLDDDDDVIVLPPTEDVVTEIPDDDDIETLDSHSTADDARTSSAAGTAATVDDENSKSGQAAEDESSSNAAAPQQEPRIIETRIDDDIAIQEPTIEKIDVNDLDESESSAKQSRITASQIPVKVKEEPKDDDEVDEEDELFEDVGTIESSMVVESSKEADTVDLEAVSSPTPPLESTSQGQLKPSIDGNVDMQDTLSTGIITNRIKINITKAKTTTANTASSSNNSAAASSSGGSSIAVLISGGGGASMYDNSNDDLLYGNLDDIHGGGGGSGAGGHNENSQSNSSSLMMMMHEEEQEQDANNKGPVVATAEETTDIDYDLKPSLRGIVLTRQPRVANGSETSGLCSIM